MYEDEFPLRLAQLRQQKGVSARDMSLSILERRQAKNLLCLCYQYFFWYLPVIAIFLSFPHECCTYPSGLRIFSAGIRDSSIASTSSSVMSFGNSISPARFTTHKPTSYP